MSRVPAQLPLGVGLRDDATFNNYYASGANALLVEHLTQQFQPSAEPFIYLWGAQGVGEAIFFKRPAMLPPMPINELCIYR